MAYSLNTGGSLYSVLAFCIAVDSDGTTIKEFLNGTTLTINGGVSTSSATWKGTTRGYFTTNTGVDPIVGTTGPSMTFSSPGVALFCACSGMSAGSGANGYMYSIYDQVTDRGLGRLNSTSSGTWLFSGGSKEAGGTALPTNGTTKFSYGGNYVAGGQKTIYYGLESGSLASDGTATDTDFPGSFVPKKFGGASGLGTAPANYHIMCGFNRALTLAEMQSLHGDGSNDWFSTLFVPPPITVGGSAITGGSGTGSPGTSIGL